MKSEAATVNPGVVVVQDLQTAGAIVWWRLSGDTDIKALGEAWGDAGLDKKLLPSAPSITVALTRACTAQQTAHRLIRALPNQKGWAVVDETSDKATGTLSYQTVATAKILQGNPMIETGADDKLRANIWASYESSLGRLTVNDVSTWLTGLTQELKAVSLRDTGGVYFIPRDQIDRFRQMAGSLKGVTKHQLFEVPALKTEEAVEAILDAVLNEADREVSTIETELDTSDLKARALRTRSSKAEALREKVEAYEQLLGRSMGAVKDRIEALKASIVAAELAAQAETDGVV